MGRESITAVYRKKIWKKAVYFAAAAVYLPYWRLTGLL